MLQVAEKRWMYTLVQKENWLTGIERTQKKRITHSHAEPPPHYTLSDSRARYWYRHTAHGGSRVAR